MTEFIGIRASELDNERYVVHSRLEIVSILRSLIEHSALITASFGDHDQSMLTALLSINPDFEELILDCGSDEADNRRLLAATRVVFTTQLDHIRIQFSTMRVEATMFEHRPALRTRMPQSLTRLQRRDSYRVRVPMRDETSCRLHLVGNGTARELSMRVFDVSCGGMALVDLAQRCLLEAGAMYSSCALELKDIGRVVIDLEIMHIVDRMARNAVRSRLCGCRFHQIPNATATLIQRYINRIEREQKALT